MTVELTQVVEEVIIDDSKATPGAARVVTAMESMATASDQVRASTDNQAKGLALLDQAIAKLAPAQESALRRLNSWKAQADPVEASLMRLSRAEQDFNRAISQGLSTEADKARTLDLLWQKSLGAAEAQERLNAAQKAITGQSSINSQLGVKDDFGADARAADIAAYGQELDRLEQKYVPLVAAQTNYERQIEEISRAQKVGVLSSQQAAAAMEEMRQKTIGAAEAQAMLNASIKAQNAQGAFNSQLGVKDDFGAATRSADIAAYGQEIDRLRAKYNPLYAAQQQYLTQLNEIKTAYRSGAIPSTQEYTTAIERTKAEFAGQVQSIKKGNADIIGGWNLNRNGMLQMQAAGVNSFQALASGMDPFRVATMEGAQVLGALVQGGVSFKNILSPLNVGLAATAAAIGIITLRAVSLQSETREITTALRVFGHGSDITTGQVKALSDQMRALGVSRADTQAALIAGISIPGRTIADIQSAIVLARDFSAAYGTSVDEATKKLVELRTRGYPAILQLNEAYHFLSDTQAKLIVDLVEHGQQAQAVEVAYGALETQIKGVADEGMTPMLLAIKETKKSWGELIGEIAGSDVAVAAINSIASAFESLAKVLGGNLTGALDAWSRHVQNDPGIALMQKVVDGWLKLGEWTSGISNIPETAHAAPYHVASGNDDAKTSSVLSTSVEEQINAYQREIDVLNHSAETRDAYRAKLEAEVTWRKKGADETTAQAMGEAAYQAAMAKSYRAVNDNISQIQKQIDAQSKIADAYGISMAAGQREEIVQKARIATLGLGAAATDLLTAAELNLANATAHTRAEIEHNNAALNIEIAQRKARASQITDINVRHTEDLAIERQQKINQLSAEHVNNAEDFNRAVGDFDAEAAYRDQERYYNDVREVAQGYSDDIKGFLLDGLTGVTNNGKSMWSNMWDAALDGGKRFLINFALTLAEQQFIMPIVTSIVGDNSGLVGIAQQAAGGSSGGVGAAGSQSGLGGLSSISSLSSLSSSVGLFKEGVNWASNALGYGSVFGATYAGAAGAAGTALGATSAAASGATLSTIYAGGASGSIAAGTLGTGAAGAASGGLMSGLAAIPIAGWIAMAVIAAKQFTMGSDPTSAKGTLNTLLMPSHEEWMANPRRAIANLDPVGLALTDHGLPNWMTPGGLINKWLGNTQPSNEGTAFVVQGMGEKSKPYYDPDEYSANNTAAASGLIDAFTQLRDEIISVTGGTFSMKTQVDVGSRDGVYASVGSESTRVNSLEAALDFLVKGLAKGITGVVDADYQRILAKGGTAEEVYENLAIAKTIKSFSEDKNITAASDQLKDLLTQFSDLTTKARELGLATTDLIKSEKSQLEQLSAGLKINFTSTVQQFIGQYLDPLKALQAAISTDGSTTYDKFLAAQSLFRDVASKAQQGNEVALSMLSQAGANYADLARNLQSSTKPLRDFLSGLKTGDLANLTPMQQLNSAKDSYAALKGKAAAGDTSVLGDLQSAAQSYLQIAQAYGASGKVYQDAYTEVTTGLSSIITGIDGAINTVNSSDVLAEINAGISPLITELTNNQTELLAGIQPSLDDINSSFRDQIDAFRDEGIQTRALLAQIAAGITGLPVGVGSTNTPLPATTSIPETTTPTTPTPVTSIQDALANLFGGGGFGRKALMGSTGLTFSALTRAGGGPISGPGTGTSDDVPLWGSDGEYVVKASRVQQVGVGFMDAFNAGQMPFTAPSNDNSDVVAAINRSSAVAARGFAAVANEVRALSSKVEDLTQENEKLRKTVEHNGQYAKIRANG